jgi:hypothetical protein
VAGPWAGIAAALLGGALAVAGLRRARLSQLDAAA